MARKRKRPGGPGRCWIDATWAPGRVRQSVNAVLDRTAGKSGASPKRGQGKPRPGPRVPRRHAAPARRAPSCARRQRHRRGPADRGPRAGLCQLACIPGQRGAACSAIRGGLKLESGDRWNCGTGSRSALHCVQAGLEAARLYMSPRLRTTAITATLRASATTTAAHMTPAAAARIVPIAPVARTAAAGAMEEAAETEPSTPCIVTSARA